MEHIDYHNLINLIRVLFNIIFKIDRIEPIIGYITINYWITERQKKL